MNKKKFLNWKVVAASVAVCCLLFVGVYYLLNKDGVRASYNDSEGYTYSPEDPLFAATHFHLFAQERISMDVHTHGNVACKTLNAGVDFGTRRTYFSDKKSDEISYARKLENINPNAVAGLLILGSDYKVTSPKGANQTVISGNNSSFTLNEISSKDIVFEKEKEHVLDLDGEFDKLKKRSKEWAKVKSSKDIVVDITSDQNNRFIDFSKVNMESGVTCVDIPYEDWAGMSTPITLKNLDTNNSRTGIVVLNIDLKGNKNANLRLNEMKASGREGDTVNINNNEVAPSAFGSVRVVYNLFDSSEKDYIFNGYVEFGGVVYGTVLAPGADLSVGAINGSAIARNILHSGGESHRNDVIKERTGEEHISAAVKDENKADKTEETDTPKQDDVKETDKPNVSDKEDKEDEVGQTAAPSVDVDEKDKPNSGNDSPAPTPSKEDGQDKPEENETDAPKGTPNVNVSDKDEPNSGNKNPTQSPESGKATPKATEKATEKPVVKDTPKPTKKPTEKPAIKDTPKPTKKPTEKPAVKDTPKPTKKPTAKPVKTPNVNVSDKDDSNSGNKKPTEAPKTSTAKPAKTPEIHVSDKDDSNSGNKKPTHEPEVKTESPTSVTDGNNQDKDETVTNETPSVASTDDSLNSTDKTDANSSSVSEPSDDNSGDDASSGKTSSDGSNNGSGDETSNETGGYDKMSSSKSEKDTTDGSDESKDNDISSNEDTKQGLNGSKDVTTTERVKSKYNAPKTGDDMNFATPICIMIVSFVMFVVLLIRKRSIR